jgi:hypothetical protein
MGQSQIEATASSVHYGLQKDIERLLQVKTFIVVGRSIH